MAGNYRAAFRAEGSAAFSAASFVMRVPIAIYPLGLILLISTRTHHYGFAGVLSGAFVLGGAVGTPIGGRLVDRYGQGRVLLPLTAAHVAAAAVLVVLAREHAPDPTLLAPAFVVGLCYVPVGSLVRARWSLVWEGHDELATAYAFESTADEIIFTLGPLIATVIATQLDPTVVIILAAALVGVGALWLAPQRASQPPAHPVGEPRRRSALRERGMVLMVLIATAMGAIFASAEVAMVAFCGHHHQQSYTGLVLAAMAIGSATAGFWYGGRTWTRAILDRYRIQALVFGVLPWLFLAAVNVATLAVCAFVVGLAIAPALITLLGLVPRIVESAALTEGLSWVITGINIGYGIAAAVVGRVSDTWGTRAGFGVTIVAATTLAVLSLRLHALMGKSQGAALPG